MNQHEKAKSSSPNICFTFLRLKYYYTKCIAKSLINAIDLKCWIIFNHGSMIDQVHMARNLVLCYLFDCTRFWRCYRRWRWSCHVKFQNQHFCQPQHAKTLCVPLLGCLGSILAQLSFQSFQFISYEQFIFRL
jgi:hypothetical protein